jgi:hypothetical protein
MQAPQNAFPRRFKMAENSKVRRETRSHIRSNVFSGAANRPDDRLQRCMIDLYDAVA